ncbi:MAG: hypothetical protein INR70_00515 [Parafilimonas terrae]|nr:hypothetical protein [Parafilimonas terrae]
MSTPAILHARRRGRTNAYNIARGRFGLFQPAPAPWAVVLHIDDAAFGGNYAFATTRLNDILDARAAPVPDASDGRLIRTAVEAAPKSAPRTQACVQLASRVLDQPALDRIEALAADGVVVTIIGDSTDGGARCDCFVISVAEVLAVPVADELDALESAWH